MRKTHAILIPLLMTISIGSSRGFADGGIPLSLGEPVDLGAPLEDVAVLHSLVGEEEGEPVMYFTVSGDPGLFHVVALENYRLKATYPLPGSSRSWGHALAPDGTVYIGGVASGASAHLYRYHPAREEVEDLGVPVPGHKFIWGVTADDEGRIYGGTWEGGHVFRYDPSAAEFFDYGRIHPGEEYVRSIAWYGGYVYAGTGTRNGRVWRLDPASGKKQPLEIPRREEYEEDFNRMGSAYHVQVAGGTLFTFFSTEDRVTLAYDLESGEWWDETFFGASGALLGLASEDEKTFYLFTRKGLLAIDLETRESRVVRQSAGTFRGGGWVDLSHSSMGGPIIATATYGGSIALINPATGEAASLPNVAVGQATPLQTLEMGPDGLLYVSGYMGTTAGIVKPDTGETRAFTMGQAEGIAFLEEKVYWGEYPHAEIKVSGLADPARPTSAFHVGHHQDRPFAMTPGDGKLFIGTIPGYGRLGGALTVYDPAAPEKERVRVHPDIIPDQSIVALAYHDGRLYGSTSIYGGLGIEPTEEQGKVFAWDPERERIDVARELDLEGVGSPRLIGGLSAGPDGNLWGAVNGALFVLDPKTLEVVRRRIFYPEVKSYGRWRPSYLRWGSDGLLYCNPAGRITIVDPETLSFLPTGLSSGLFTVDEDALYYVDNPRIVRVPLVRQAD